MLGEQLCGHRPHPELPGTRGERGKSLFKNAETAVFGQGLWADPEKRCDEGNSSDL